MRRFLSGVLVGIVIACLFQSPHIASALPAVKLIVDGKEIKSDVAPLIVNDRVMVPLRFAAEALGSKVEWDSKQRAVVISTSAAPSVSSATSGTKTANQNKGTNTTVKTADPTTTASQKPVSQPSSTAAKPTTTKTTDSTKSSTMPKMPDLPAMPEMPSFDLPAAGN